MSRITSLLARPGRPARRCPGTRRWALGAMAVALATACSANVVWVDTVDPAPTTTTSTTTTSTTTTTAGGARHRRTTTTVRRRREPAVTTTTGRATTPGDGSLLAAGAAGAATRSSGPSTSATSTTTGAPAAPPHPATAAPPPAAPAPAPTLAPLTGLPMDPALFTRPVLVVKIDNAPKARPQVGLNDADVVFEEGVEGGITRFAALFHSRDAALVGPVRSARSTDIHIMSALHRPLFAYSGANALFKKYVEQAPLVDVGVERYPDRYHRDDGRPRPDNLFSGSKGLFSLAPEGSVPPPALFSYREPGAPAAGPGGRPVREAHLFWKGAAKTTDVLWDWDPTAAGWKRTQNGEAHVDSAGLQVTPPNVVIQFVTYHDTGLVDSSGTAVPEADVVGRGDAWVLTGGMLIPCHWEKRSDTDVTRYTDASGADVRLAPGRTWVELVPPGQAETQPPALPAPPVTPSR